MMPRFLQHPGFRRLSLYADGDLDPRARARTAAHLAGCPECRAVLGRIRSIEDEARALPSAPPPELRERVLARHRAGERALLPLADAPAPRTAWPRRAVAAAAAALLVLVGLPLFVQRSDLEANRSELVFEPARPEPGGVVRVTYRPGSGFAAEGRLRLRALYRNHDALPISEVGRLGTVGELVRNGNGVYEGTLRLPDSVAYAAFAVEDPRGERVDSNRESPWELLVHGPDGRPSYEALEQRLHHHMRMNPDLSYEIAKEAAALYPDRVRAVYSLFSQDEIFLEGAQRDSARARARARLADFDARLRGRRLDPENELGVMSRFAGELGDTARHRYWQRRLLREAPNSLWGVQERLMATVMAPQSGRALAVFDTLWEDVGVGRGAVVYLRFALDVARQAGDTAASRRWAERVMAFEPAETAWLGSQLALDPGLRETGMDRLRSELRALGQVDDASRPLERSVPEERRERQEQAGKVLAALGEALLEAGRRGAALDTLQRATRTGWDAGLFRRVGGLLLQAGDTAGAVPPLALAAADPLKGAALSDSARILLGSRHDEAAWRAAVAGAREEMRERVMRGAARRRLPDEIRLRTAEGRTVSLRELAAGRPVFIAYWSRHCEISADQIPQLQEVAAGLAARGFAVVTISERQSPEFRRYLGSRGLTLPLYEDPRGELRKALNQTGWPNYFVIDPAGDLRFGPFHRLEAVPARMALVAEAARP